MEPYDFFEDDGEVELELNDNIREEESYDASETEQDEELCVRTKFTSKSYIGLDKTRWRKKYYAVKKTKPINIIKDISAPKSPVSSITGFFHLFITKDMIEEILRYTNTNPSKNPITFEEFQSFIGILLLSGLEKSKHKNNRNLFNPFLGISIFRLGMAIYLFIHILQSVRFDDKSTRESRKRLDKATHIRYLLDTFYKNCYDAYTPGVYLTIDEMLPAFRGKCPFRQYMPNKPAKYGIKFNAIVDFTTFYTLKLELYAGTQP